MAYIDVVEKAINSRLADFENVVENGDAFDAAIASVVVLTLKDLKKEIGLELWNNVLSANLMMYILYIIFIIEIHTKFTKYTSVELVVLNGITNRNLYIWNISNI